MEAVWDFLREILILLPVWYWKKYAENNFSIYFPVEFHQIVGLFNAETNTLIEMWECAKGLTDEEFGEDLEPISPSKVSKDLAPSRLRYYVMEILRGRKGDKMAHEFVKKNHKKSKSEKNKSS